jgi:hypothetical protein
MNLVNRYFNNAVDYAKIQAGKKYVIIGISRSEYANIHCHGLSFKVGDIVEAIHKQPCDNPCKVCICNNAYWQIEGNNTSGLSCSYMLISASEGTITP